MKFAGIFLAVAASAAVIQDNESRAGILRRPQNVEAFNNTHRGILRRPQNTTESSGSEGPILRHLQNATESSDIDGPILRRPQNGTDSNNSRILRTPKNVEEYNEAITHLQTTRPELFRRGTPDVLNAYCLACNFECPHCTAPKPPAFDKYDPKWPMDGWPPIYGYDEYKATEGEKTGPIIGEEGQWWPRAVVEDAVSPVNRHSRTIEPTGPSSVTTSSKPTTIATLNRPINRHSTRGYESSSTSVTSSVKHTPTFTPGRPINRHTTKNWKLSSTSVTTSSKATPTTLVKRHYDQGFPEDAPANMFVPGPQTKIKTSGKSLKSSQPSKTVYNHEFDPRAPKETTPPLQCTPPYC